MEENVAFAKQKARGNLYEDGVRETWKDLADQLNSRGPPVRDWKTWRKVWNDFKFETRKKIRLSNMYKSNNRHGIPQRNLELTANQRRVRRLLGMDPMASDNEADPIDESANPPSPPIVKRSPSSLESASNIEFHIEDVGEDPYEESSMVDSSMLETSMLDTSRRHHPYYNSHEDHTKSMDNDRHISAALQQHLQVMLEHNEKMQMLEERRLELEERRLAIEEERLRIEQKRLRMEEARFSKGKPSA